MHYATCVFCDEVRQEDNGKKIYLGVYGTRISAKLPFKFDGLSIAIKAIAPVDDPLMIHNILLHLPKKEKPISFPISVPPRKGIKPLFEDDYPVRVLSEAILNIKELEVRNAGRLIVELETDKGIIFAGSLFFEETEKNVLVEEKKIDVDAVLMAVMLSRKLTQIAKKDSEKYHSLLMDVVSSYVAPNIEKILSGDDGVAFEVSRNSYIVISLEKMRDTDKILFRNLPDGVTAEVADRREYSFKVKFKGTNEEHIEGFEWFVERKQKNKDKKKR
jgi:hypothetical protein